MHRGVQLSVRINIIKIWFDEILRVKVLRRIPLLHTWFTVDFG